IGWCAFYGCYSLTSVYCKSTTPPTAAYDYTFEYWEAFDDNWSGCKIYVPRASESAYKAAEGWSDYADSIEPYDFTE
ncbi:MAG: hypothetical protein II282_03575, partial [Alistipes sp.]|nr:hypothetical protein [Alistipes sp.]